ncbi:protein shisa-4 isoform X2 [Ictalurus furcatus]|uniref:protein shisa-4 isoform X2 n=1 Tax=Ictalurus furcatus TaxID=66913 RepID=UPI002350B02A|nr:protein shisa-4 isoform X2 [Ictalurus furcatus]
MVVRFPAHMSPHAEMSLANANEDCQWYVDKNGTWHNGFNCPLITFCCGNCHHRYCCLDRMKMITESGQKRCMLFHLSPSTIAGIASSILLFVAAIATMVCCFMCSCCYLYQRHRQHGRTSYDSQQIPMASYPMGPMYDAYGKPIGNFEYSGYAVAPQYPGMPQQCPSFHQMPYPPCLPANPGPSHGGKRQKVKTEYEYFIWNEQIMCSKQIQINIQIGGTL